MLDPKLLDDIAAKLSQLVPPELHAVKSDLHKNFRQIVQNALTDFDFVTREEFDVQARVLTTTRQKLSQLSQQIAELEAHLLPSADSSSK